MHTAPWNRLLASYEFPEAFFSSPMTCSKKTAFPWVAIKFTTNIHFSYSLTLNPQSSRNKNNILSIINYTLCQYVYDTAFSCASSLKLADFCRFSVQLSWHSAVSFTAARLHLFRASVRLCWLSPQWTYNVLANAASWKDPEPACCPLSPNAIHLCVVALSTFKTSLHPPVFPSVNPNSGQEQLHGRRKSVSAWLAIDAQCYLSHLINCGHLKRTRCLWQQRSVDLL